MENVNLKFYYNGVKVNGGKLCGAHYVLDSNIVTGMPLITVYADSYTGFPDELGKVFPIVNDSDTMTDYFDKDQFAVESDSPYFAEILACIEKARLKREARIAKRDAK